MTRAFEGLRLYCRERDGDTLVVDDVEVGATLSFSARDASDSVIIVVDRDQVAELSTRLRRWLGDTDRKWVDL